MATPNLTVMKTQILGTLLVELLNGELSDETVAAVDLLQRDEVPEPFKEMVAFMHGMSTEPYMRNTTVAHLLRELSGTAKEAADTVSQRPFEPPKP